MIHPRGGGEVRDEGWSGGAARGCLFGESNEVLDVGGTRPREQVDESQEDFSGCACISERAVLGDGGGTEVRGDRAELVITHERAGQREARES